MADPRSAASGGPGPSAANRPALGGPALADPLDAAVLAEAGRPVGLRVVVVTETGSTNADVAARARAGEPAGLVIAAERQSAGRGRLDRSWVSPPGSGLTVSLLARPAVPAARLGWVPMVVGTSLVATLRSRFAVPAWLKWPNDVQVGGDKLAGILVELIRAAPGQSDASRPSAQPGLVIGFGLNVHTTAAELPPGGTSLAVLAAATTGQAGSPAATGVDGGRAGRVDAAAGPGEAPRRTDLLAALLTDLAGALASFDADPAAARQEYREVCATLGRDVRVELPGGETVVGVAGDVDEAGRLVVDGRAFSAADVVHLRPAPTTP
ncbi:biotin--[acetyl-CoA-carboxylase] ligase [Pseudofrankia sp. BMG5.37]|uniref:biotin--[acetyl-CoA-carboxylase] ligase n=1 Tax=Pseudofrankia sp. BMG5.37 TaxID=3050035 RepID=UPI0037C6436E